MTDIPQTLHDTVDTVGSDYTSGATSLVLSTGQGAKYAGATATAPYYVRIENEVLKVTGRSSDTLTVAGAQDGTSAASHVAGKAVEPIISKTQLDAYRSAILALEADFTPWTTWTPTLTQSGSVTHTLNRAKYKVVDGLASVVANFAITGSGTAGQKIVVGGIPAGIAIAGASDSVPTLGVAQYFDASVGLYTGVLTPASSTSLWMVVAGATYMGENPNMGAANGDLFGFTAHWEI